MLWDYTHYWGGATEVCVSQKKTPAQTALHCSALPALPVTLAHIPTVFCRTMLLAFSVPGEPVVVALLCLMGAWPGWSRLHPLENDLSTETF